MTAITSANKELSRIGLSRGSALILTVVLTSLLAIVGVMFLMISRIDRMATSAISEKKQLDLAVDTVVGKISEQLVWDVPGTIFSSGGGPEYHDYPGPEDRWLASSEPHQVGPAYFWRHISDIYDKFDPNAVDLPVQIIPDYQDPMIMAEGLPADADGDGIADSIWVIMPGITSSKGEPVYTGVRITDNGGKLNVNTGFEFYFDPCFPDMNSIDGTSLLQINLMALANRPGVLPTPADVNALLRARANYDVSLFPNNLDLYEDNVSWRYSELSMPYTPFDISDELELRNRFLLNQRDTYTRIEQLGSPTYWAGAFRIGLEVPIDQGGSGPPPGLTSEEWWFNHANISGDPSVYDYRHLATTYSMDRIINPLGLGSPPNNGRMLNVNTNNAVDLRDAIRYSLQDANPTLAFATAEGLAAQLAVNMIDFVDDYPSMTVVDSNGTTYYGYERPCIYISEVTGIYTSDTNGVYISYAVELHKPYFEDESPKDPGSGSGSGWQLVIDGVAKPVPIDWSGGIGRFHVVLFEDPNSKDLAGVVDFNDPDEYLYAAEDPNYTPISPASAYAQDANFASLEGRTIHLQRSAWLGRFITVDSYAVPAAGVDGLWVAAAGTGTARSFRRDISRHKCIRRLWDSASNTAVTLGHLNTYTDTSDTALVQAHPYLDPAVYRNSLTGAVGFKNVGEISMVFDVNAYNYSTPPGSPIVEADLRLDLRDPMYARIFNYLTVMDPTADGRDSDGDGSTADTDEIKVPGRININTAPSFVLEQLPWMWMAPPAVGPEIADMVVAYRDGLVMPGGPDFSGFGGGFGSIGELMQVSATGFPGMDYYRTDGIDQDGFPDLTPLKTLGTGDGAPDDFEERDLIFHRISNLITVRSDVFTAYILVRIGADGPQRRVLAILDRSNVEPNNPDTKVKVRALHKVADPW